MVQFSKSAALLSSASLALGQFCEHQWEGDFAETEVDGVPYRLAFDTLAAPAIDIQPLIVTGPSENRVDLLFMGDGYTEDEREKFLEDAMALAKDLTDGQTFADVLPLMNFWAGFTASNESGIGVGGVPKDTVYGLYRDGTELRGVYYDKPAVARAACQSTEACDYPILLGNDPYYGGLGGSFTVVTASPMNGAAVLRHELGHSIIGVGEEYDGGSVYRGVNSARVGGTVPWTQWYTNPETEPRVQRNNMPIQAYPWTLLETNVSWVGNFQSAGTYDNHYLQFSVSGMTASTDLVVAIDGKDIGWEIKEDIGLDRWIYSFWFEDALAPGPHALTFTLLNPEIEGTAQLCNLQILEYGTEEEFTFAPEYHGLYPTFSASNATTYRPTNDHCLMRTMHSVNFCDACIEGLWMSLIRPLSLIEDVTQTAKPCGLTNVTLDLLPLGQFREIPRGNEAWTITWFEADGTTVIDDFANSTTAIIPSNATAFEVEVQFWTEQVRVDRDGLFNQRERYELAV